MMTQEQAQKLRVLLEEAFDLVLGRRISFAMAVHDDQDSCLDIITNTQGRGTAATLLKHASMIAQTEPDGTIEMPDHRATGESAGAKSAQEAAPGMECGHAAPQASDPVSSSSSTVSEPAAPAVSERCWRQVPPAFTEQCPNDATGGVRLKLYPALSIQKRYGKRDMLALILDLPVCPACFAQMTALEVINNQPPGMWQTFTKVVQQRNSGILPIKEQSEIEHLPFDDPEYQLLRRQSAKQRAESQPAPAGPQPEGAGDGN